MQESWYGFTSLVEYDDKLERIPTILHDGETKCCDRLTKAVHSKCCLIVCVCVVQCIICTPNIIVICPLIIPPQYRHYITYLAKFVADRSAFV